MSNSPDPPQPSPAEIERAVCRIVRRMLPRLQIIAARRYGTVVATLVDGRLTVREVEPPPPDEDLYRDGDT